MKNLLSLLCLLLALQPAANLHSTETVSTLPGGIRPLDLILNGEWIGNGVCFSTFRHGQRPRGTYPSDEQILADLRLASRHWGLLRTYECDTAVQAQLRLIRTHHLPVRLLLGVWITPEKSPADAATNEAQVAAGIRAANEYREIVAAVIVGNETQVEWSGVHTDPAVLTRHLRSVRAGIQQPVTTADDYGFWDKPGSEAIAAELDFITLHMYALWNGRSIGEAMEWTAGIHRSVSARHPGKPVLIGETGWATSKDRSRSGPGQEGSLMKAEASVANQEAYLRQHYAWVLRHRIPTLLFEAFDEDWKGSGPGIHPDEAEKHWGVFDEDRRPKPSFQALLRDTPEATRRLP